MEPGQEQGVLGQMQANRFFWAIYISLHFKHANAACIQRDLQ